MMGEIMYLFLISLCIAIPPLPHHHSSIDRLGSQIPHSQFPSTSSFQSNSISKDPCVICFEKNGYLESIKCQGLHAFHPNCIRLNWIHGQTSCPMCREPLKVYKDRLLDGSSLKDTHESYSVKSHTKAKQCSWKNDHQLFECIKSMPLEQLLVLRNRFTELEAPDRSALLDMIKQRVSEGTQWRDDASLMHYIHSLTRSDLLDLKYFIDALRNPELSTLMNEMMDSIEVSDTSISDFEEMLFLVNAIISTLAYFLL